MKKIFFLILYIIVIHSFQLSSFAQVNSSPQRKSIVETFYIKEINIFDNKITKKSIILRELAWRVEDRIPVKIIDSLLSLEENKLYNTDLFITVDLDYIILEADTISIHIRVKENWYIWPLPIFNIADRNFSNWLFSNNRDLKRLEYGLLASLKNFRGRRENLNLVMQLGFTRKLSLRYRIPFINRKQTIGLTFRASLSENKKLNHIVLNNRDTATISSNDSPLRSIYQISVSAQRRRGFYQFHNAEIKYRGLKINDTIVKANPNYLIDGMHIQKALHLRYSYVYDFRDRRIYPLKGFYFSGSIEKVGVGIFNKKNIDYTELRINYARFSNLSKEIFFSSKVSANAVFGRQSFETLEGLGFSGNTVRGYELYVINATHYGVIRNDLKWRFLNKRFEVKPLMPIKQFSTVPIWLIVRTYIDIGYSYRNEIEKENRRLSNRFISGWGIGVDLVTFYNLTFNVEYSFNDLGESGFFFNISSGL